MANKYLYSGAAGTGTGADWTNAYTAMATAAAGMAAGDDLWVALDHSETTAASITPTFPGTLASPNRIISVSRAGSVPPVAADITAGAVVTTTGASNIGLGGFFYMYGVTFNVGTGASAANLVVSNSANARQVFEASAFNLVTTNAGSVIRGSASVNLVPVDWINCTASFGAVGQGFSATSSAVTSIRWMNKPGSAAITGATIPTNLISSTYPTTFVLDGLDLSTLGSGKNIVAASSIANVDIINCKLAAAVTVSPTPTVHSMRGVRVMGCGSSTLVERNEIYHVTGTLTTETTIIRTAGASDGTTPYSWKIVSTANAKRYQPFETFEGAVWNATTGSSKTLTFHCVTDNVTLQDADIFVEVEYLGSSATPVTTLISSAPATQLTAGSNLATDTEAWTTTGLTTPVKQKFSVTFTPQMAGPIRWKVKVAKASTTVYVDPNPDLA